MLLLRDCVLFDGTQSQSSFEGFLLFLNCELKIAPDDLRFQKKGPLFLHRLSTWLCTIRLFCIERIFMKTIGLLGGLTWLSTLDYYRIINEEVQRIKGGDEAARMVLYSVNFAEIKKLTQEGNWEEIARILSEAARNIEVAGADCLLIGANTMHLVAERVHAAVNIPLIHIADATAQAISQKKITRIGLLGTKYTMQFSFYPDKLSNYGIETIVPGKEVAEWINTTIYEELGKGKFLPGTRKKYIEIINQLKQEGAEGVILGCTEIPLLIKQQDTVLPVFDTTRIHALAAVAFALKDDHPVEM